MKKRLFVLLVAVLFVSIAQAAIVEHVVDGSFDAGAVPPTQDWGYWGTAGEAWNFAVTSGSGGVVRASGGSGNPWWGRNPQDGLVFVALSSYGGSSSYISQQLGELVIGEVYSLSYFITQSPYDSQNGTDRLQIYIGSTLLADYGVGPWGWYGYTNEYTANALDGSNPVLKFAHVNGDTVEHKMCIDNISLMGTAVPEPATMALLGLGGLIAMKRRHR